METILYGIRDGFAFIAARPSLALGIPLVVFIVWVVERMLRYKTCPHCKTRVPKLASVCAKCTRNF